MIKNKGGQVTIFIIVGIVIVVLFALLFLFKAKIVPTTPGGNGGDISKDPGQVISQCIKEKINEASNEILLGGGYLDSEPIKTMEFEYKTIPYLCYTPALYSRCFPTNPVLMDHLKSEITNYLDTPIDECFLELKESLRKDSYVTNFGEGKDFNVEILTNTIKVSVNKKVEVTKAGSVKSYDKFVSVSPSPLYTLAEVASRIVEEESKYCNSEHLKIMQGYPKIDIKKFTTGDDNKIYTLTDEDTNKKWRFATKGCTIPIPN